MAVNGLDVFIVAGAGHLDFPKQTTDSGALVRHQQDSDGCTNPLGSMADKSLLLGMIFLSF